jgi:hypothetical protein
MNKNLTDNNYLMLPNFIEPERANQLYEIYKQSTKVEQDLFTQDGQCPKSLSAYDYHWFIELLIENAAVLSDILQEPLLPTYCYSRLYRHGEILAKHSDRPACEISVTLNLGSDGTPWPIHFTKPNGDIASVELTPGQAAVYLGCESDHWRDAFQGQEYGQVFLHYVRSRGPHWDCYFDKKHKN